MIDLVEELYPSLRWFLFDGLMRYSVPLTIFGPRRAFQQAGRRGADFVERIRTCQRLRLSFYSDLTAQTSILEVATGLGAPAHVVDRQAQEDHDEHRQQDLPGQVGALAAVAQGLAA